MVGSPIHSSAQAPPIGTPPQRPQPNIFQSPESVNRLQVQTCVSAFDRSTDSTTIRITSKALLSKASAEKVAEALCSDAQISAGYVAEGSPLAYGFSMRFKGDARAAFNMVQAVVENQKKSRRYKPKEISNIATTLPSQPTVQADAHRGRAQETRSNLQSTLLM